MQNRSDVTPGPVAVTPEGALQGVFLRYPDSPFELFQPYPPAGDQPVAIDQLVEGVRDGEVFQTLLGVTGSGKTFTMMGVPDGSVPGLYLLAAYDIIDLLNNQPEY